MPTATLEEYLEAIYKLSQMGVVRPGLVAEAMGVSAPTVTATLRRLATRGLVTRPGGAVSLTPEGEREALSIVRRHRLAERFLVDVLGLPWEEVHEDACLLEHALSPKVQDALERFLDSPEFCPHGHPIPSSDLVMEAIESMPLAAARIGASVVITSVGEDDEAVLAEAARMGLVPGQVLTVLQDAEHGLIVESSGDRVEVSQDVVAGIKVADTGGALESAGERAGLLAPKGGQP